MVIFLTSVQFSCFMCSSPGYVCKVFTRFCIYKLGTLSLICTNKIAMRLVGRTSSRSFCNLPLEQFRLQPAVHNRGPISHQSPPLSLAPRSWRPSIPRSEPNRLRQRLDYASPDQAAVDATSGRDGAASSRHFKPTP
jgi:hypothetical protein